MRLALIIRLTIGKAYYENTFRVFHHSLLIRGFFTAHCSRQQKGEYWLVPETSNYALRPVSKPKPNEVVPKKSYDDQQAEN